MRLIDANVLHDELMKSEDFTRKEVFKHERSGAEYWMHMGELNQITKLKHLVFDTPTVEAKHVVHGEWVEYEVPHIICCSECDWGTSIDEKGFKFCPNCGADMRGGKNE